MDQQLKTDCTNPRNKPAIIIRKEACLVTE